jgi:hypothetical protein
MQHDKLYTFSTTFKTRVITTTITTTTTTVLSNWPTLGFTVKELR